MGDIDIEKLVKKREYVKEVLEKKKEGDKVELVGWVHNSRDLSKIKFILLRDISGVIQVTGVNGKTPKDVFSQIGGFSRESVIYVKGSVKNSKQAPGGKEIFPEKIIEIAHAEDLLIDVTDYSKTELSKRLDYRFLDFHRKRVQAIFKIQSEIARSFREHFYKKDFIEMQSPGIISASSEGGTELFPVKYFEKNAYLAQSPQLYKQMVACSMEKTVMITPVWRAEKHNTTRHINEVRQMDIEMAFTGQKEIMKQLEEAVKEIVSDVLKNCEKELELLEVKLKVPKSKYLSYDEAVKLVKIKYGEDLTPEAERKLDELFPDTIVFVHTWPVELKSFYIMPQGEDPKAKLSEGFDAIYKGIEISSGGQRIHLPNLLPQKLKDKGLDPKNFKAYIDSFRYGAPPHSGWSIGLERLTEMICGLDNIREATMFPRDRDRLTP